MVSQQHPEHAPSPQRRIFLLLVLAAALTTLIPRPLFDPDEGRYVAVALEMLDSGDWFTPHLRHDLPHVSKPPLAYWLLAGSMKIFGAHVTAARLPWTLCFLATAFTVAAITRRLAPERELVAALVYATMILPWAAASIITADTPLTLFESLAMLGFIGWLTADAPSARWLWLSWLSFGLAALTKGPPGLLPLLPIVAYLALRERSRLPRFFSPLPVIAFLLISTSWYIAQAMARPDILEYWIGTEVVGRLGSSDLERNSDLFGGFRVYVPTLLAGALPWLVFQRRKERARWREDHRLLVALWFGIPLAVFFVARSRLPFYLLPLAVPAAVWMSTGIDPARFRRRRIIVMTALWVIVLGTLATLSGFARPDRNGERLAQAILAETQRPDEVVFVNENPAWSLRFYLGTPLQRVNLHGYSDWGDIAYRPLAKSVDQLVTERDARRVYLLPHHHYVAFRNEMRENGREPVRLGHYERLVIFGDRPIE